MPWLYDMHGFVGSSVFAYHTAASRIYNHTCGLLSPAKDAAAPRKTRELWKAGDSGRARKARRHTADDFKSPGAAAGDDDGDVEMTQQRGPRGGRREARRKKRNEQVGRLLWGRRNKTHEYKF